MEAPVDVLRGFERGIRIGMPTRLSGRMAEYFLPSPIMHVQLFRQQPGAFVPLSSPLIGPWLLCDVRQRTAALVAGGQSMVARTTQAIEHLRKPRLSLPDLLEAHTLLGIETARSRLREAIAWVDGTSPDDATLVPPPSSALPGLLADLLGFLARTDLPTWVMQALAYYQLIQIHPVADGNGRLGRALVAALALRTGDATAGLLSAAAISLNREGMTRWHAPVRDGDIEPYLARWRGIDHWVRCYLAQIAEHERALRNQLRTDVESDNAATPLFMLLAQTPLLAERDLVARMRWSARTAPLYLDRLKRRSWLSERDGLLVSTPVAQARQRIIDELAEGTAPLFM